MERARTRIDDDEWYLDVDPEEVKGEGAVVETEHFSLIQALPQIITTRTPLELYKRNADDRDGGLLTIDPDSPEAFDRWYDIPSQDKWEIQNPSHMWEVIQGSSRTRVHLFVSKKDGGYVLSLSTNEYCCPEYAARFYLALRHNGIPVTIFNAEGIADYLLGRGKVGFVPCFNWPTDYYYGGFSDKAVLEFRHFPEEHADVLSAKTEWYPIAEVSLKEAGETCTF